MFPFRHVEQWSDWDSNAVQWSTTGMHKSRAPKFLTVTPNDFGVLIMELACPAFSAYKFGATLRFLEKNCAPQHTHTHQRSDSG